MHFLIEKRTEMYNRYIDGVSEMKNVFGAKSGLQGRAWLGLERRGA